MKVNELRVGNFVMYADFETIFTVYSIEKYGFGVENNNEITWIGSEEIEPVPLTEEWLLKFGFKKTEWDNSNSYLFVTPECDYSIVVYSNGYLEIGGMVMRKIDYVHQLQNFVFALSGVELTIDNKC
jgi:hypothetical protein